VGHNAAQLPVAERSESEERVAASVARSVSAASATQRLADELDAVEKDSLARLAS